MNENRRQILEMLAGGKITADEAERLLAALDPGPTAVAGEFTGTPSLPFVVPENSPATAVGPGSSAASSRSASSAVIFPAASISRI